MVSRISFTEFIQFSSVQFDVLNFPAYKDLLATLQKSLDRTLFLYNFICQVRSSGVRGFITIMHIRKFFKLHNNIVRFRFFS